MNTYNMGYKEAVSQKEMQKELAVAIAEARQGYYISVRGFGDSENSHIYGIYIMSPEEYCNYVSSGGSWSYLTYEEFIKK